MAVTIHANPPGDLYQLMRDLQLLEGSGNSYRIRRALHGSGAIVEDDLALAWLILTRGNQPEFLQSLMRQDPNLYDLVGRRASDAALQELARFEAAQAPEADAALPQEPEVLTPAEVDERSTQEVRVAPEVPAKKASKSDWEQWAIGSGLVGPEQGAVMTKAQLQELAAPTPDAGQSAPEDNEEG